MSTSEPRREPPRFRHETGCGSKRLPDASRVASLLLASLLRVLLAAENDAGRLAAHRRRRLLLAPHDLLLFARRLLARRLLFLAGLLRGHGPLLSLQSLDEPAIVGEQLVKDVRVLLQVTEEPLPVEDRLGLRRPRTVVMSVMMVLVLAPALARQTASAGSAAGLFARRILARRLLARERRSPACWASMGRIEDGLRLRPSKLVPPAPRVRDGVRLRQSSEARDRHLRGRPIENAPTTLRQSSHGLCLPSRHSGPGDLPPGRHGVELPPLRFGLKRHGALAPLRLLGVLLPAEECPALLEGHRLVDLLLPLRCALLLDLLPKPEP